MVSDTSSQSFGCRGKEALLDLQVLTAQVRKLRVRSFIFGELLRGTWWWERAWSRGVEVSRFFGKETWGED